MTDLSYPFKRFVDWSLLVLVAVPALVVGFVTTVAVKATSRGPVLFRQTRTGLNGAPFECLKFRSMVHGDNPLVPDAERITRVGRWLRRYSLDELPQLVNVARNDMSIVGPRPMLPFQFDRCNPEQVQRFSVRPGLTGWAQINGRNGLTWSERVVLDVEYVRRQSVFFDLRIVMGTASVLVGGHGVEGHDMNDPFVTQIANNDA